jgi:polyisoprenoid-binding protein YceI
MTRFFAVRATLVACSVAGLLLAADHACCAPLAIDGVHSSVLFRIKHLGTSHAWGRFNDISGKLALDDKNPSIEVQIKADSIDTGNAKRDQHLKSPDFFNARQFPTISFKSTRIQKQSDGKYAVDGTLKLHGVEQPLSVQLERAGSGKNQQGTTIEGFDTTFKIKRSDYGMKFLLEGLSDEVLLNISLECAAQ